MNHLFDDIDMVYHLTYKLLKIINERCNSLIQIDETINLPSNCKFTLHIDRSNIFIFNQLILININYYPKDKFIIELHNSNDYDIVQDFLKINNNYFRYFEIQPKAHILILNINKLKYIDTLCKVLNIK